MTSAEIEQRMNDFDKRIDKMITVQEYSVKTQEQTNKAQEQTTANIKELSKDMREQRCSKNECERLNERVKRIETIFYRINWIVITPIILALVYLVIKDKV